MLQRLHFHRALLLLLFAALGIECKTLYRLRKRDTTSEQQCFHLINILKGKCLFGLQCKQIPASMAGGHPDKGLHGTYAASSLCLPRDQQNKKRRTDGKGDWVRVGGTTLFSLLLGKLRQEDQKFKGSLCYRECSSPGWAG